MPLKKPKLNKSQSCGKSLRKTWCDHGLNIYKYAKCLCRPALSRIFILKCQIMAVDRWCRWCRTIWFAGDSWSLWSLQFIPVSRMATEKLPDPGSPQMVSILFFPSKIIYWLIINEMFFSPWHFTYITHLRFCFSPWHYPLGVILVLCISLFFTSVSHTFLLILILTWMHAPGNASFAPWCVKSCLKYSVNLYN